MENKGREVTKSGGEEVVGSRRAGEVVGSRQAGEVVGSRQAGEVVGSRQAGEVATSWAGRGKSRVLAVSEPGIRC